MGCGSLVIASGKVEFVNEVSSTPFVINEKVNFKNELKSEHKLVLNVKQNNFSLDTELKTTGSLSSENKYEIGKNVTGFSKVSFDNNKLASSLKYDFSEKETELTGSYKYTQDKLTLKPYVEVKFDVLKPAKVTLGNESSYKFDDSFTLKNDSKFYTTTKTMKGKLPKYVEEAF